METTVTPAPDGPMRDPIADWIRRSFLRDVRAFYHGGKYHCEARVYPDAETHYIVVATGTAQGLMMAYAALAAKLPNEV